MYLSIYQTNIKTLNLAEACTPDVTPCHTSPPQGVAPMRVLHVPP